MRTPIEMPRDDHALVDALGSHADPLSDDAITGDYRVWQRVRGHRYSLDDVITAEQACVATPRAGRHADVGCGLGSVLLMVAWRMREHDATHLGVEAQAVSFALASRNVERNALGPRVALRRGDLREVARDPSLAASFDLVTGTPPYVPPGRSTPAPDPQKAYARIEYRGGVEDYLAAMARLLAPGGRAVLCCDARMPERALDGARLAGLDAIAKLDVVPRQDEPPLLTVWTFAPSGEGGGLEVRAPFVARDVAGARTQAYLDLRTFFGLPPVGLPGGAARTTSGDLA